MAKRLDPDYVRWPELLNRATSNGLHSTCLTIHQIPTSENGHMAVVHARVQFEDGRVFEDVGDATPGNTNDTTANALLRMASTRAKARCLRDALNIGEVADVELPTYNSHQGNDYVQKETGTTSAVSHLHGAMVCSNHSCRRVLNKAQYELSTRKYGEAYCPSCQKLVQRVER